MRRWLALAAAALAPTAAGAETGTAQAAIGAPAGLQSRVYATGLGHPTNLAFDARGRLWATSTQYGPAATDGVWLVPGPRRRPVHVVRGLKTALGLTWHRGELFVSSLTAYPPAVRTGLVTAFSGFDGARFRRRRTVVRNLPVGLHSVDSIVPGPDGRLYLGIGSQFDARASRHRLSGTVVSFLPSGRGLRVEGRGFRNPYGMAFVPGTADLLVSDNGRDDLGLRRPPEELNLIRVRGPARWYGFPQCWGQATAACRGAVRPLARLAPHAAAGGVAVLPRLGPYGLSAYVAENGSSFAANPTGSDVVRVGLVRRGAGYLVRRPARFGTGYRRHDPLGVVAGPDGALYVSLFQSGSVVRFSVSRTALLREVAGAIGRLNAGGLLTLGLGVAVVVSARLID